MHRRQHSPTRRCHQDRAKVKASRPYALPMTNESGRMVSAGTNNCKTAILWIVRALVSLGGIKM